MNNPQLTQLVPVEHVERLIHLARGEIVLLDADLATLYGVETKVLNRAVKRNRSRFPHDFMFQLTAEEAANLRCQIGTSSSGYDAIRELMSPPAKPKREIGFHIKEDSVPYRVKRKRL